MTAPKTPLLDELAGHDARMAAARQRARSLAQAAAEHADAIGRLKEERVAAYSQDDERKANALKRRTTEAADKAGELEERREGADIAAQRAQRDRDLFVSANHGGIVAERAPSAREAVKMIEDAIAALTEGVRAWRAEAAIQVDLLRPVAGRDGREIPDLPIYQLVRDLGRAVQAGVPAPMPPQPSISRPAPPATRVKAGQAVDEGDSEFVFEPIS